MITITCIFVLLLLGWYKTSTIKRDVEARFPPIGQLVEVLGERIHLVDTGDKTAAPEKTIVMLHGATSNLRDGLNAIGIPLSTDYRVIAIDRPGHGWSTRNGGVNEAELDAQARILTASLAKIGVKKAVFLGHSWAGALVMKLALDYTQSVSSIVLISPVTHPWPGGVSWYHSVVTTPIIGDIFVYAVAAPIGQYVLPDAVKSVFSPSLPPEHYLEQTGAELVFRPEEFRANSQDLKMLYAQVVEQSPRYKNLKTPALIITSDTDTVVSPTIHSKTLAQEMPQSKLVILDGAGHAPHYSRTQEVLKEIREFMKK